MADFFQHNLPSQTEGEEADLGKDVIQVSSTDPKKPHDKHIHVMQARKQTWANARTYAEHLRSEFPHRQFCLEHHYYDDDENYQGSRVVIFAAPKT